MRDELGQWQKWSSMKRGLEVQLFCLASQHKLFTSHIFNLSFQCTIWYFNDWWQNDCFSKETQAMERAFWKWMVGMFSLLSDFWLKTLVNKISLKIWVSVHLKLFTFNVCTGNTWPLLPAVYTEFIFCVWIRPILSHIFYTYSKYSISFLPYFSKVL